MNTLQSIAAIGEILAIFVFCLGTSVGIAYVFLRAVVSLSTRANYGDFKPAGLVSRRSLSALFVRASHNPRS